MCTKIHHQELFSQIIFNTAVSFTFEITNNSNFVSPITKSRNNVNFIDEVPPTWIVIASLPFLLQVCFGNNSGTQQFHLYLWRNMDCWCNSSTCASIWSNNLPGRYPFLHTIPMQYECGFVLPDFFDEYIHTVHASIFCCHYPRMLGKQIKRFLQCLAWRYISDLLAVLQSSHTSLILVLGFRHPCSIAGPFHGWCFSARLNLLTISASISY